MTPTIDGDGVPDFCLSLRVRSDWGHFKKYGRTASKQTYQIIPRTALAGLLAGIVGVERDGYYDTFGEGSSAVAITPESPLRTINVPTTGVSTDPGSAAAKKAGSSRSRSITYHDTTQNRQIHNYEVLVDPAYRIDVAVEDEEFYSRLKTHLEQETATYPPSMGLSEYLASIEYIGEFEVDRTDESRDVVGSVVPGSLADVVPQPGVTYRAERSPAIMEQYRGGRRTTRYDDIVYTPDPEGTVRLGTTDRPPVRVNGETVVFR
jgi:CRISPR-associated protein Cas5h